MFLCSGSLFIRPVRATENALERGERPLVRSPKNIQLRFLALAAIFAPFFLWLRLSLLSLWLTLGLSRLRASSFFGLWRTLRFPCLRRAPGFLCLRRTLGFPSLVARLAVRALVFNDGLGLPLLLSWLSASLISASARLWFLIRRRVDCRRLPLPAT